MKVRKFFHSILSIIFLNNYFFIDELQNCQNDSNEMNEEYSQNNLSLNSSNLLNAAAAAAANSICLSNNNTNSPNQNRGACYIIGNSLVQFQNDGNSSQTLTELQPAAVYTQLPSIDTLGNKSKFRFYQ